MHDGIDLISTLAVAFGLALLLGFLAERIKLPALLGYLLAGVIIGPATPGFVANVELSMELAEIGVMLLMFGVGLHFSLEDLLAVRGIALPGAVVQIAVATGLGLGLATLWGWPPGAGLVFGLSLSVASTVVLLKALESRGQLGTMNGRIAIGWLVVEDLVMVLVLVLLPPLAGALGGAPPHGHAGPGAERGLWLTLAITLGQVALFVALMLVVGRRLFPWFLWQVARTGSRELFSLGVVAAAVGIAWGSAKLFGVSLALGAFFAGMVMRESALSHRAATESLPLRDAFAVLFFVSVGMLVDPALFVREPGRIALTALVILVGKSLAAAAIVLLFRYPLGTALTVSASLAQIGEFSFILAGLGVSLGLLPVEGQSLVLAGALVSIALNPLVFGAIEPVRGWLRARSRLARELERPADPLAELPATVDDTLLDGHAVIVGYGRVGQRLAAALRERGVPLVVAEQNREQVEALRAAGLHAVAGDAADAAVLVQAHTARAGLLVLATPDPVANRRAIELARMLKPDLVIVARAHAEEEAGLLRKAGADTVLVGEHELADALARRALDLIGP